MNRTFPLLLLALAAGSAQAQALPASPAKPAAAPAPAAKPSTAKPSAPAPSNQGQLPASATPEQIFAAWDKDKNRQLSVEEFRAGVEAARMAEVMAQLEQQFIRADTNKSKKIEAAEYAQLPAIKRAGAAAPPFATFDTNKDGGLEPQEYIDMVQAFIRRNNAAK